MRHFFGVVVGVAVTGLLTDKGSGLDCGTEVTVDEVLRADCGVLGSCLEEEAGVLVSFL